MNRRFKIEKDYEADDHGSYEWLCLKVQVPYKCFGKVKYTYTTVYQIGTKQLPELGSKQEIIDFMLKQYQEERKALRMSRIIRQM